MKSNRSANASTKILLKHVVICSKTYPYQINHFNNGNGYTELEKLHQNLYLVRFSTTTMIALLRIVAAQIIAYYNFKIKLKTCKILYLNVQGWNEPNQPQNTWSQ